MIDHISFSSLHRDEYFTFGKRISEVFSTYDLEALNLQRPYQNLVSAINVLDNAMIKTSTAVLTKEVLEKDANRDNAFLAIRNYLRACTKRLQPEWQKAADLLLHVIRSYGDNLHRESYSSESARLNNLLADFSQNEKYKAAIEVLQLNEWVVDLQKAQNQFELAESKRLNAKASTSEIKTDEACAQLRKSIEFLFQFIELNNQLDEKEEYQQMIRKINKIISEFMTLIRARKTRNSKEFADEQE